MSVEILRTGFEGSIGNKDPDGAGDEPRDDAWGGVCDIDSFFSF
jgi:hypothetical protein